MGQVVWWYEIIGIVATLFIIASFLTKDLIKVRIVNLVGSVIFIVYGVLIHSWSTAILNAVMIIVHLVYLLRREK